MERRLGWNTYDIANKSDIADTVHKFGRNQDVDTATTPEGLWSVGGLYPFPLSALATTVVSSSANDNPAGTGVGTIRVEGCAADWSYLSADVALNGLTPVALPTNFFRVFRAAALTLGAAAVISNDASNIGTISVQHPGPVTIAQIDAGLGQTLMAIYTVPVDYPKALLMRGWATMLSASSRANLSIRTRINQGPWRVRRTFGLSQDTSRDFYQIIPEPLEPKTDILMCIDSVTSNNSDISGGFDLYLMKSTY